MKSEIGFFSCEIGLSSQFWSYEWIKTTENQGKVCKAICENFQKNFRESRPEVRV